MDYKEILKAILIRVVKTWCQAFVGATGVDAGAIILGIETMRTLSEVDWKYAASVATAAAIVCFIWNLGANLPEVRLADTLYALENDPDEEDEEDEAE
jgi:hypothetical protein